MRFLHYSRVCHSATSREPVRDGRTRTGTRRSATVPISVIYCCQHLLAEHGGVEPPQGDRQSPVLTDIRMLHIQGTPPVLADLNRIPSGPLGSSVDYQSIMFNHWLVAVCALTFYIIPWRRERVPTAREFYLPRFPAGYVCQFRHLSLLADGARPDRACVLPLPGSSRARLPIPASIHFHGAA